MIDAGGPASLAVHYRNTAEDLTALYEHVWQTSFTARVMTAVWTSIGLFLAWKVAILCLHGRKALDSLLWIVLMAAVCGSFFRDVIRRQARNLSQREAAAMAALQTLVLSETGVESIVDQAMERIPWSEITQVTANDYYLFLFHGPAAFIIPRRAFRNPFAAAAFLQFALEKMRG